MPERPETLASLHVCRYWPCICAADHIVHAMNDHHSHRDGSPLAVLYEAAGAA